jgi:hypothetical protein
MFLIIILNKHSCRINLNMHYLCKDFIILLIIMANKKLLNVLQQHLEITHSKTIRLINKIYLFYLFET